MKSNLSIRFYLKDPKEGAEKHPIFLRIIYARKKAELFTGLSIEDKNWHDDKQRAKKENSINDRLSTIESEIRNILYSLEKDDKTISAGILKDIYTGKDQIENTLITFFELHIKALKQANELVKGSISRYEDTLAHLRQFAVNAKKTYLPLAKVDFKFLNEFDIYLKTQLSDKSKEVLERNTVNKHHSRLRTVLIKAFKEGELKKNPYQDFKFKYSPSKRTFLTEEELGKIKNHDLGTNQSLIKVRDIFLFSVYTGLRFRDAQNLKLSQVIIDKKGNSYLNFIQEKTKENLKVPLFDQAIEIINKNKEAKVTGLVLPKISNQKFNVYLKMIGELAGIDKVLSHHVARHTCATTILLSNEAPIEAVSKWLGHTNIRTTQIYAKITNDYLQKVANKISDKI